MRVWTTGVPRAAVAVVLGLLATSPAIGQAPAGTQLPQFRSGVRAIEFDVVVTDEDGAFVPNLTKDDFEVLEGSCPSFTVQCTYNLRPQEVASVWEVNLPIDRRGRPLDPSTVPGYAPPEGRGDVGRVYVLMLKSGNPQTVRRIGRLFVEEFLGPTDLMAVLHGDLAATRGLTNNREALLEAIDQFRAGGGDAFFKLKEVAVNLNAVSGRRKSILFVGTVPSMFDRYSEREYDDAVRTAVRNNVRIYPIDPTGFTEGGVLSARSMAASVMAADTGGIAIANTSNYTGNFGPIVRDNSAYYTVVFYSSAERDGAFHQVSVRVKGRPKLTVRSRMGYRSTAPDVKGPSKKLPSALSETARNALRASSPVTGLPLEIFTAVFQAEKYEGSVLVGTHVPGAALKLAPKDRIELSYVAVDRWGKVRAAERRAFTLMFDDAMRARVESTGLRLFGRMQLPRGTYEIRVAAHQPGGSTGSAVADVEVPDYTTLPMSVSDLILSSSRTRTLTTLEEDPVLRRALPSQPTVDRQFARDETLTVFGEIYDTHWIFTREIGVTTVIRSETDGRVVVRDEQTLEAGNQGRFYYTGRMALGGFKPGRYQLVLEAYTRDGVPASASQDLRFVVRDVP
jgi:VWFA-related protein